MTAAPALELDRVRYRHPGGAFALAVERLALAPGERVAVVGPSGTGKTTLVELAAGIRVPDAGEVRLAGAPLSRLSDARRRRARIGRIGLVFQELELLEHLSALDNVLLPYLVAPQLASQLASDGTVRARARALAEACGVAHVLARPPRRLSHGERQRVAVCRALVTEPELLLCDEPTASLDPASAAAVVDLLVDAAEARGAAVLLVTHDPTHLGRFDRTVDVRALGGAA